MHEMSLMKDLIAKILHVAKEQACDKVTSVTVELGALSHISAEHFTEHFVQATQNTIIENAELDIIENKDFNSPTAQDILLLSIDVAHQD